MELSHLITFQRIAETGSVTRAAETLYLTQPAASAQIKALEHELGIRLFRRGARGMILTDAGRELLKAAREVLQRTDDVMRLAQRLRDGVAGTLRLAVMDCGFDLKLARIIGRMTHRHPETEVHMTVSNSGNNIRAIIDQTIDLAMIEGDFDAQRITGWRLGTSHLCVIAPPAWGDDLMQCGWQRLAEFPWIFQSESCSYCMLLRRISEEQNVQFKPQFRAEDFGTVKNLVAEGLALSVADRDDVAPMVEAGHVVVWPHFTYKMPVWLIALSQRAEEPMLRAFVELALDSHRTPVRRQAQALTPPTAEATS